MKTERRFTGKEMKLVRERVLVMSQREFSKYVGITQQHLSLVERENVPVSKNVNERFSMAVKRFIDMEMIEKLLREVKKGESI